MSDILIETGKRIKDLRKSKKLSQKDLADRYSSASGVAISTNMVSMWETGKRRMYIDQFYYLCVALDMTPTCLFPQHNEHTEDIVLNELRTIRPCDFDIIRYMFMEWKGNTNALIQFMGLYMCLPNKLRQDIAGMGCHMYEYGLKNGQIDEDAPTIDYEYVLEQTNQLWKWKQSEL